jgi:hypothetical protein
MKFLTSAPSILLALLLLTGCDSLNIPNPLRHDQVPDPIKEQPLIVEKAPPVPAKTPWPLLGEVPTRPKDFSPKPVYDHYMDELEYERDEDQQEQKNVESAPPPILLDTSTTTPINSSLNPPQFPKE